MYRLVAFYSDGRVASYGTNKAVDTVEEAKQGITRLVGDGYTRGGGYKIVVMMEVADVTPL